MTQEPVARITDLLESNGYTRVALPLTIGGLEFTFSSILLGEPGRPELVVVVDTVMPDEWRFAARRVEALSRALDLVGSHRSLTIVLAGPAPDGATRDRLRRYGRVLHADYGSEGMFDDLAVLLPLKLPDEAEAPDPVRSLREHMSSIPDYLETVLDASNGGAEDVTAALLDVLAEPFLHGGVS